MPVRMKQYLSEYKALLMGIVISAVMTGVSNVYLTNNNLWGIMISTVPYGIAAIGTTFILLSGEKDISMGSTIAFSGVICAMLMQHMAFAPAVVITLVLCVGIGAVFGYLVAYQKLGSFMISISLMISVRGLALFICGQNPVVVASGAVDYLGKARIGVVPLMFLIYIAMAFAAEWFLRKTQFCRNIYMIGNSNEVAESTGVNVNFHKLMVFVIGTLFAGLGGIAMMVRMRSGSPVIADGAGISVIPMVIMGGTAFSGGKGGSLKSLSGVILMNIIYNVMSLYNIDLNVQNMVKGGIVLGIVVTNRYMENRNRKI